MNKKVGSFRYSARFYDLIYQSDVFGIPYLSIKSLLKYGLRHTQAIQNAQVGDENYFKLPLRDYIYVVR